MTTKQYSMPAAAERKLDALVDRIEANPGKFVQTDELLGFQERLNLRPVLSTLPESISHEDFIGILKLAMLTESATDSYANAIHERAMRYDAHWLARFNENVWAPDERTHHTPYRAMFLDLGYSDADLDHEIRETREREYLHESGDTPLHITTFGMIQEYLTDNWHGLIGSLLRDSAPEAAQITNRVKQRETLHTLWYRDMTALQLEAEPGMIGHVSEALVRFQMPGQVLLPDLQDRVPGWLPKMGADFDRMTRDLIRLIHEALGGSVRNSGELLLAIAAEKGMRVGPLDPRLVRTALGRLGGPSFGLVGEALLLKAGLGHLYSDPLDGVAPVHRRVERIRSVLREWIADRIEIEVGYEDYAAATYRPAVGTVARSDGTNAPRRRR